MTTKSIARAVAFGAIFLVPVFPLIVANSYFFPFITGKAFYFRILVEIAFAAWVILAFAEPRYRPRLNPLTVAVTAFTLIALVADLLGVNPVRSIWSNFERMEGWLTIIHVWAFFIASTNLFGSGPEAKRLWQRWFNLSLSVAGVVGIYGLFQIFGWAAIHQGSTRIDASLGNAAYMAVYMLFHAFLAAYSFFAAYAKRILAGPFLTWLYAAAAVFFSFLVFETATRGTILGLIGGVMLAALLYALTGGPKAKKARLWAGGFIVLIIVIGAVFWMNRDASFVKNSVTLNRLATISWSENKTQARGYIWPMALKGWTERPVLGWGQENFNYIFNARYNPAMWNQEQWFDRAHSVYLDWLVASGALGFLAYLSLYVLFIVGMWRSKSLSPAEKSVMTGLLAGYAIHNVFVFDNLASYTLFFAILGFAVANGESRPWKPLGSKPMRADAVEYVVAPVAIVLLATALYFLNVKSIQANTRLIYALSACGNGKADYAYFDRALAAGAPVATQEIREQLLSCAIGALSSAQYPGPVKQAFFQGTSEQIQAQIAAVPDDARSYALAGIFYLRAGQYAQSAEMYEKALKLSPGKQSIMLPLATDYLSLDKADEAIAILKQAYESAPDNREAADAYAMALVASGREADARRIFADRPGLFESERMISAYVAAKQYDKAASIYRVLIAAAGTSSEQTSIQLRANLAEVQYQAGQIYQAISTLRAIAADYPAYATQIEAAVKQVQEAATAGK